MKEAGAGFVAFAASSYLYTPSPLDRADMIVVDEDAVMKAAKIIEMDPSRIKAAELWTGGAPEDAADRAAAAWRSRRYSPGYCGWHITAQRKLFAALQPAAIGVSLNASCLMEPLKSVSGVILAGPPAIHEFEAGFPFCRQCRDRSCGARLADAGPADIPHGG